MSTSANVSSSIFLEELGTGTLTISGTVNAAGVSVASGGTLALTGGGGTGFLGTTFSTGLGTLLISSGTYTTSSGNPNLNFGSVSAGTGGVDLTGGTWTASGGFAVGRGAVGLMTINGGTLNITRLDATPILGNPG